MIKCQLDDDIRVPTYNLAQIEEIRPKSIRVVKNQLTTTYTRKCLLDPKSCGIMESLDPTALTHGVYLSIRNQDTLAQCPEKTVLTDQDPEARTKTCHLDPIKVLPPVHLPATNQTLGADMLTSVSILDMPTDITLTRLNLLYHSQKLDLTVSPALHWLWDHRGHLRRIVRIPTGHFFTTMTCLAAGFVLLATACICYLCKCCGCTKLSSCLSCRSRTVTVERTRHDPQQNPRDPPSRTFTRILATSCMCCRYPGRSDSLDVVSIAGGNTKNETSSQPDHTGGQEPGMALHSNLLHSLSQSAQMLDKHLGTAPPAYHSSPGLDARGDHELPGAQADVTSSHTTQF